MNLLNVIFGDDEGSSSNLNAYTLFLIFILLQLSEEALLILKQHNMQAD